MGSTKVLAAENQMEIEADGSVNYNMNTNITIADKKVKITNQQGIIQADHVIYDANQGLIDATGHVEVTHKDGTIVKASELHYDINRDFAEFSGDVDLITKESRINAQKIIYDGVSGDAQATGEVKITQPRSIFQSESFDFNLKTEKGETGPIQGTINQVKKNLTINSKSSIIDNNGTQFNNVTFTTCPKPNPDFIVSATKMKHEGKWIKLWNPVLFIKGIPVFYFPYLVVPGDGTGLPSFDAGYNDADGIRISASYGIPTEDGLKWTINSTFYSHSASNIGVGLGTFYGNISNYSNVYYYLYNDSSNNYFSVSDQLYLDYSMVSFAIDGAYDANSTEKQQYGIALNSKYWSSPVGNWQFGVLVRKVFAYDGYHHEYGGTYGGYRVEYNPNKYLSFMTFSLLQLYPIINNSYRDFLDNYHLGSNWSYLLTYSLNPVYSVRFTGTFNSDENLWIHRIYSLNRETCCFKLNIGWDDVPKSVVWSAVFKF